MPLNAIYRQNAQLIEIARDKLPVLTLDDPLFRHMPLVERRTSMVVFEQKDNIGGLLPARGYDGPFGKVERQGSNIYSIEPGQYGGEIEITESRATKMAAPQSLNDPIDLRDLQQEDQDRLMSIGISRILHNGWTILRTGLYQVLFPDGALVTTAQQAIRKYIASDWSDPVNSTPLADLRAATNTYSLGTSFRFGAEGGEIFMNTVTINHLLANRNVNDLGQYRVLGVGSTVRPMTFSDLNTILAGQGLPTIVRYDNGYFDQTGRTFTKYLPDREFVWFGSRPDATPLEWIMTINVNGDGMQTPGMKFEVAQKGRPWRLIDALSFNGGAAIYYATGFVAGSY